jgi:pyruvate formate lyase activating enzyme
MTDSQDCLDRRRFLRLGLGCAGLGLGACGLLSLGSRLARAQDRAGALSPASTESFPAVPARYWKKLEDNAIECQLCPHHCRVLDGLRGACGVRENRGGSYYTLVYSRAVAANVDPIEKKPFYHYRPGTTAFSIATAGCNMHCQFCQNWQISQFKPEEVDAMRLPPAQVHAQARAAGSPTIACTYNEPTVWNEYVSDTAALASRTGIRTVVISSGMTEVQPLRELLPRIDAMRIDLKSFRQDYYARICGGQL